jgi:DNA-directed RNA polymerase specialized sigma24 family protein
MFEKIPSIELSAEQKKKCLEILGNCNLLLKKWAVYYNSRKFHWFCAEIFRGNNNPAGNIPTDCIAEFENDLNVIRSVRKSYDFIDGKTVEDALLQQFSAMAYKFAKKQSKFSKNISFEDLLQESYFCLYDTIYLWMPNTYQISTYIHTSLKNRFINRANVLGSMLCPLTNSDMSLVSQYNKFIAKCNDKITFEEAVESMNLSFEDAISLQKALNDVKLESSISNEESKGNYTDRLVLKFEDYVSAEESVENILNKAGLNSVERELILLAMENNSGWQTEYAKTHISPVTKKPYCRMRITQLLSVAREKVAKVLSKEVA